MVDNFFDMWRASRGVPFDVFLRDAPIMAHSIDKDGRLLNVSTFWATRLGYEPHEMIGLPSIDFLTPRSRLDAIEKHLPKFWATGRMSNVRYQFQHKEGEIVPVIMSATSIPHTTTAARSLAVMFDNGIAMKMDELNKTAEDACAVFDEVADSLPYDVKERLGKALEALKADSQT